MNYKHLTQEERYQIAVLSKANHSILDIAKLLNRSSSTISRELKRNTGLRGYRPQQAHRLASQRKAKNAREISQAEWQFAVDKLNEQWSPEQISHFIGASHESIYQYIYRDKKLGGLLYLNLRRKKRYRKRGNLYDSRGCIVNPVRIDKRPEIVDKRGRYGDFEVDTIIGRKHKQAIVSIVERKSGFALLRKVTRKTALQVSNSIIELLSPIQHVVHTITGDNGKEFAYHEVIAKNLDCDFYFAHPYSSWERGTNENTNGLVRQYFPKNMDFANITDDQIKLVMDRLNNRPRKRLNYKTPMEVFSVKGVALRT